MSSTSENTKNVELDANKALQMMLNGVAAVQTKGKYTFEESYFTTQALYGLQSLSAAERNEAKSSSEASSPEKVMRVTWPEDFTMDDYIQVIIRHLEIGQQRGAFNFNESALIGRAIEFFRTSQQSAPKTESVPSVPVAKPEAQTARPKAEPEHQQTVVL